MTQHATLHASRRVRGLGAERHVPAAFGPAGRRSAARSAAKKKPSLPRPACRVTPAHFHRRARMTGEALTGVAEGQSGPCHSFADAPPRCANTHALIRLDYK